jgi:heme exporter protein D
MSLGPHAAFIVTAYLVAAAIVIAMIAWVVLDRRRLRRELAELEARSGRSRAASAQRFP